MHRVYVLLILSAAMIASGCGKAPAAEESRGLALRSPAALTVVEREYKLEVSGGVLHVGQSARITVKNGGAIPHDLVIDGTGQRIAPLLPGRSVEVEFVPGNTKNVTLYCSLPGHRDQGMVAVIPVESSAAMSTGAET